MKVIFINLFAALTFGEETGFVVKYGVETAYLDKLCVEQAPGVLIIIHGPDEVPGLSKNIIQVKAGEHPKILLKPAVTLIDIKMEALDPFTLVKFGIIWFNKNVSPFAEDIVT